MYRVISWLTIVVLLGLFEGAAIALDSRKGLTDGSDLPIDIKSKRVTARNVSTGREVTFDGNVKVQQGDLILTCDRLVIVYEENEGLKERPVGGSRKLPVDLPAASSIKSITASGNVKIAQKEKQASAAKALFDNVKRTITLSGGPPMFRHGLDSVVGDKIILYLGEDRFEVLNGDNSPQIKARLNPSRNWKKDPTHNGKPKAR